MASARLGAEDCEGSASGSDDEARLLGGHRPQLSLGFRHAIVCSSRVPVVFLLFLAGAAGCIGLLVRSRSLGAAPVADPPVAVTQLSEAHPTVWPLGALGTAHVVQTSRHYNGTTQELQGLPIVSNFDFDGPIIRVNVDQPDQVIVGFGGAFTDSTASVFQSLSSELQGRIIEMYFGAEGLQYNLGRVPINSCDFSLSSWSFDDTVGDTMLAHFDDNLTHDAEAKIPMIQAALRVVEARGEDLTLFASPWSPPAWMKTNGKMTGSSEPGLKPEYAGTWAAYLSRWVSAYKNQNISMWAMTVQNEPTADVTWESCKYTAEQEASFVGRHLGPTFQRDHPDVLIFSYDAQKDEVFEWANVTLQDPDAAEYYSGVAVHWYMGDYFERIAAVHEQFPEAILIASEATWEANREAALAVLGWNPLSLGEGYAHDIIGDLNAGIVAWTDWNLVLNLEGGPNHIHNYCAAAVTAGMSEGSEEMRIHPQFYYIGHFSKYIPRGSRRLPIERLQTHYGPYEGPIRTYGTCDYSDGLQATSVLRPDGQVAVVALNCADFDINFKLQFGARAIRCEIPSHSIQTYLFHP